MTNLVAKTPEQLGAMLSQEAGEALIDIIVNIKHPYSGPGEHPVKALSAKTTTQQFAIAYMMFGFRLEFVSLYGEERWDEWIETMKRPMVKEPSNAD